MIQGTVPRPARDGANERDNEPSDPGMQTTLERDAAVGGMAPDRIRHILADLVGPLAELHRAGRAHGDISPATIGLDASGRARLLSLPVAPTANAENTPRRDGYAAFEQYTDDPDTPCGPWTDIYALSATACALLTGQTPPSALARCVRDDYVPLTQRRGQQEYAFCAVLDNGLALDAYARPQTIGEFARALHLDPAPASRPADDDAAGYPHRSTLEDSDGLEATSAWVSTQGSHIAANASFDESTGVSPDEPIDAADASRARSDHAPHGGAWEASRGTAGDAWHGVAAKATHEAASEPAHGPARAQAHGAAGQGWHGATGEGSPGAAGKATHDMRGRAPGSAPSDARAYPAQDEDIGTETPIARTRDTGKTSRTARPAMPPAGRTPGRSRAPLWAMVAVIVVIAAALYMWLRPPTPQRGNVVATASGNTSRSSTGGASAGSTAGRSVSPAAGTSSPSTPGTSSPSTPGASSPSTGSASASSTGSASAPSTGMASTPSPGGASATSPSATGAPQLNGGAAGGSSGDQAGAGTQSPPAPWFTIPSDTPDSASGFGATGAASTMTTPGAKTPAAASTTTAPGGKPPTASSATATPDGKPLTAASASPSASGTPADSNAAPGSRTAAPNKTPVPVSVTVRPWGEILVNGRSRGVSPPLKSLSLAPGKYDITIRNNAGPDHHQTLNVTAGQSAVISHTFQ